MLRRKQEDGIKTDRKAVDDERLYWMNVQVQDRFLLTWRYPFDFNKSRGISWVPERRLTSEEGMCLSI